METCEECGIELDECECEHEREPSCTEDEHEWTREGMGGCLENPGVWSLGGTTIVTRWRCTHCGWEREAVSYGSQRNPGQRDELRYFTPIDD